MEGNTACNSTPARFGKRYWAMIAATLINYALDCAMSDRHSPDSDGALTVCSLIHTELIQKIKICNCNFNYHAGGHFWMHDLFGGA